MSAMPRHATMRASGAGAAVLAALALGACGGSGGSSHAAKSTPAPKSPLLHTTDGRVLKTTVAVSSPALSGDGAIPARYTCDGAGAPLPLTWSGLPAHTAEVALFLVTGEAVEGKLILSKIDWAVAGVDPSSTGVLAGRAPAGTVVGRNDERRESLRICPAKGASTGYAVLLYALPHKLAVKAGAKGRELRREAADAASAGGVLLARYQRRAKGSRT